MSYIEGEYFVQAKLQSAGERVRDSDRDLKICEELITQIENPSENVAIVLGVSYIYLETKMLTGLWDQAIIRNRDFGDEIPKILISQKGLRLRGLAALDGIRVGEFDALKQYLVEDGNYHALEGSEQLGQALAGLAPRIQDKYNRYPPFNPSPGYPEAWTNSMGAFD